MRNFITGDGRTVNVPMMRRLDKDAKFDYLETEDIQMLQMPYLGEKLSLIILLPKEPDITKLESSLVCGKARPMEKGLERQRIDVYIPKFKIDAKYFLEKNLPNLGMPTAFTADADFTGMSAGGGSVHKQVIHQAYVDVNEEGTEAAAATAVIMNRSIGEGPRTPVFRADHPFIFMILDEETGLILFLGRLSDPGKG